MSETLRRIGTGVLRRSPAQLVASAINRHALAVLAYHAVTDRARFAKQMDYIASHYNPVDLHSVIRAADGGERLPARAVLVTFDDGDKSIVEHALPIMRSRTIPGVLFVVAGHVGTNRPFWWEEAEFLVEHGGRVEGWTESEPQAVVRRLKREGQEARLDVLESLRGSTGAASPMSANNLSCQDLRVLHAAGIAVGNHTLSHPSLDRCDPDTVAGDIVVAHELLTTILTHAPVAFAYPGGYYADAARPVLEALGYKVAFLFDHRPSRMPIVDPLCVSRLRIASDADIDRLSVVLSGLHTFVLKARGRRGGLA